MAKKSPLGRGLGALIDDNKYESKVKPVEEAVSTGAIAEIDIKKIEVNPFQPREKFDEEAIEELAASIKELGIIQPITVRKLKGDKFQLISGERRFKASQKAGLKMMPAFIRDANDQEMLEMALVENIQREDLNAIEVAITYQRLMEECKLTQETLSERLGKKRPTITNYLRLLKLPVEVQVGVRDKLISMGHARALVNIEEEEKQIDIFYKIINEGLSVRDTEKFVREKNYPINKEIIKKGQTKIPEHYKDLKKNLSKKFNTSVDFKIDDKGKGKIILNFKSNEQLEEILKLIKDKE